MSTNIPSLSSSSTQALTSISNNVEKLLNELPKARFYEAIDIYNMWDGLWLRPKLIECAITFRSRFEARDDDVLITSIVKTGTTWLKALSLSIMHYKKHLTSDILTTGSPHFLLPTVEGITSYNAASIDIYDASATRLLHTHLRYSILPESVKNSACKIVYICRNPKDTLVSMWYFFNSVSRPGQDPFPLEKALDCFCSGVQLYGSFFDHVLEYWVESKKRPEKVLFVKYEELKSDPKRQVSKIAEFLGRPLADENDVDEVLWRSSFKRLKSLEVNDISTDVPNKVFYRKGEVGDWKTHLTPEMAERIDQISRAKLEPFGLFL